MNSLSMKQWGLGGTWVADWFCVYLEGEIHDVHARTDTEDASAKMVIPMVLT